MAGEIPGEPGAVTRVAGLRELLDDFDQVDRLVALPARKVEELSGLFDDGAVLGRSGDSDAASAMEIEQALVAERPECAQYGVGIDPEYRGKIFGRRQSLARLRFSVGDRAADLTRDLLMEVEGVVAVDLDISHDANQYSSIRC